MIVVRAIRKIENVERIEQHVQLHGFDRLTPRAARAALEIAFGNANSGEVWFTDEDEAGVTHVYGYSVYPKSVRRIKGYKLY